MLDQQDFENGHLSQTALEALAAGSLSARDTHLLLIHLEHCPACMDAYMAALDGLPLEEPPADLEQRVLDRAAQTPPHRDRAPVAVGILKLAVAVCLTMLLFFGNVFHLVFTSSENLAQHLAAASEASGESHWTAFASDFQQGFSDLIHRFNHLFDRDAPDRES